MSAEKEKEEQREEAAEEERAGEETAEEEPDKGEALTQGEASAPPEEPEKDAAAEEKQEEEIAPSPDRKESFGEDKKPEDEDTGEGEQIEEEVVLDEVLAEGEESPEPHRPEEPEEETVGETDAGEEKPGSLDGADGKGPDKKGTFVFLQKKWMLALAACLLLVGGLGLGFLCGNHAKLLKLDALLGGKAKSERALVQTVLKPFFIPLPQDSKNVAIRLVISVHWDPEFLIMYRKRQNRVRNDVYQYLLEAARSGRNFEEKKSGLASELDRVLEHALAIKNIEVRVDEIAPI